MENSELTWNVFPPDAGNRITELSKVIGQLHTEMKHIQTNHSDNPKGDPSGGSSLLGKYIHGAKNNFSGFNSNESILHEEPAEENAEDEETADVQESPTADAEPDRKSNEEQNSEGETDNAVEDMNETEEGENEGDGETGNDDVIEMSTEGEEEDGEKNTDTENTSETVIESNTDAESEASGKTEDEMIAEEAKDNEEEVNTNEATGVDQNEAEKEENGEVEESDGSTDEVITENAGEGIKMDLNQTGLVSFLAKRIEGKLEKNFTFIGNQASSPTGSDDSQDTSLILKNLTSVRTSSPYRSES